ncbi:MAG: SRPBCC domain-containing protein [Gemmatimonadota bacterium]
MTTQTAGTLEITRVIATDLETVFDAWTLPEHLKQWSAPEGMDVPVSEVDLTVGGRFHLQMRNAEGGVHNARGIYHEIDRPTRLVYSWQWDEHPDHGQSLITVAFKAVDGGTEVTMIHSGLPDEKSVTDHEGGWASCFNRLEALYA